MSELTITTLTGKKVTIVNCADTDTIGSLKQRLQDKEGVPPDQQTWHFPVPKDTKGSASAMRLKGWFQMRNDLDPTLRDAMMANPLLQPLDKKTLGEIKAIQEAASLPLGAFLVLQLRPPSKTLMVRVETCSWKTMTLDADVSTMTCSQLHVAVREALPTIGGNEADLGDYVLNLKGKRLADDGATLLEDWGLRSEDLLELCGRPDWYPQTQPPTDGSTLSAEELEKVEDRLYGEIIKAVNGHKSELRSKGSSAKGCCSVQ